MASWMVPERCEMVDEFAIKYTSLENAQHLLRALKEKYTISEDWEANCTLAPHVGGTWWYGDDCRVFLS